MELYSMLHANLDGGAGFEGDQTYVCMSESLCCPPETTTTFLISYTPIQNKFKI